MVTQSQYKVTCYTNMGFIELEQIPGYQRISHGDTDEGTDYFENELVGSIEQITNYIRTWQSILDKNLNWSLQHNHISDEELDVTFPQGIFAIRSLIAQLDAIDLIQDMGYTNVTESLTSWEPAFMVQLKTLVTDWYWFNS